MSHRRSSRISLARLCGPPASRTLLSVLPGPVEMRTGWRARQGKFETADRGMAIRRFDGLTVKQRSVRCGLATGGGPRRRRRVAGGARPPRGARPTAWRHLPEAHGGVDRVSDAPGHADELPGGVVVDAWRSCWVIGGVPPGTVLASLVGGDRAESGRIRARFPVVVVEAVGWPMHDEAFGDRTDLGPTRWDLDVAGRGSTRTAWRDRGQVARGRSAGRCCSARRGRVRTRGHHRCFSSSRARTRHFAATNRARALQARRRRPRDDVTRLALRTRRSRASLRRERPRSHP